MGGQPTCYYLTPTIQVSALKLYPDKLDAHLSSQTAAIYLLHGDEPLQLMELGDRLRLHARQHDYNERQVLLASEESDWAVFRESVDSLSLFSERRLIELRLPTGKPGRTGARVLKEYCQKPADDILLLITSARLDRGATSSAWFKAIDKAGVTVAVWPIAARQLSGWLKERCQRHGLQPTPAAIELIAERVEGNLLAANQEIERLALLYPAGELDAAQVVAAVTDSARFSIQDLTTAALQGQSLRALRILAGLKDEAVAPMLVLWALTQEIRAGARAAEAHEQGMALDAALKAAGVWQNRLAPLKQAVGRHTPNHWLRLLAATSRLDQMIKGQVVGDVWNAFDTVCLRLASD